MEEKISITCDLSIDQLVQQRKFLKPSTGVSLILERDEWGSICLVVKKKSSKTSYKLEENIKQLYIDNTSSETVPKKFTIELELPHVMLLVSNITSLSKPIRQFLSILIKIHKKVNTDEIELYLNEEDASDQKE